MNPNQLILPQHLLSLNIHITHMWWGMGIYSLHTHLPRTGETWHLCSPSRLGSCSRGPAMGLRSLSDVSIYICPLCQSARICTFTPHPPMVPVPRGYRG